jgi:hypothetical protein
MADSNTAGAGAPPAGAANGNASGTPAASAGTNNQQNMVPITALHEERDRRQALAAEVETLKQQVASLANAAPNVQTNNVGPDTRNHQDSNQFMAELDNLWREDPRRAMQTELMTALNWKDQVEAQVDDQVDGAASKYKDFNDYQSEVRKYVRRLPVEQRSKPGIIEAAYFMVKGRNADSVARAEAERLLKRVQAGDGTQSINAGASSGGGDGTTQGTLTTDQKAAAAALGISEAEYAKHMKK